MVPSLGQDEKAVVRLTQAYDKVAHSLEYVLEHLD